MEQYISKSALVAEIENLENTCKKCSTHNSYEEGLKDGMLMGYKAALRKINALEGKEVDLEEEIERVRKTHFINDDFEKATLEGRQITNIAKHFFELGVNASNTLTWKDIRIIGKLRLDIALELRRKELESPDFIKFTEEDYCNEVLKRFLKERRNRYE